MHALHPSLLFLKRLDYLHEWACLFGNRRIAIVVGISTLCGVVWSLEKPGRAYEKKDNSLSGNGNEWKEKSTQKKKRRINDPSWKSRVWKPAIYGEDNLLMVSLPALRLHHRENVTWWSWRARDNDGVAAAVSCIIPVKAVGGEEEGSSASEWRDLPVMSRLKGAWKAAADSGNRWRRKSYNGPGQVSLKMVVRRQAAGRAKMWKGEKRKLSSLLRKEPPLMLSHAYIPNGGGENLSPSHFSVSFCNGLILDYFQKAFSEEAAFLNSEEYFFMPVPLCVWLVRKSFWKWGKYYDIFTIKEEKERRSGDIFAEKREEVKASMSRRVHTTIARDWRRRRERRNASVSGLLWWWDIHLLSPGNLLVKEKNGLSLSLWTWHLRAWRYLYMSVPEEKKAVACHFWGAENVSWEGLLTPLSLAGLALCWAERRPILSCQL